MLYLSGSFFVFFCPNKTDNLSLVHLTLVECAEFFLVEKHVQVKRTSLLRFYSFDERRRRRRLRSYNNNPRPTKPRIHFSSFLFFEQRQKPGNLQRLVVCLTWGRNEGRKKTQERKETFEKHRRDLFIVLDSFTLLNEIASTTKELKTSREKNEIPCRRRNLIYEHFG